MRAKGESITGRKAGGSTGDLHSTGVLRFVQEDPPKNNDKGRVRSPTQAKKKLEWATRRTICAEASALLGRYMHPEISRHTHCLDEYMAAIERADWGSVAELMLDSARKLQSCGADFLLAPDNTIHRVFTQVAEASPLPWLNIAEEVARAAKALTVTGRSPLPC